MKTKDLPNAFQLKEGLYYHSLYDDVFELKKTLTHSCKKCDYHVLKLEIIFIAKREHNFTNTYSSKFPGIFNWTLLMSNHE